MMVTSILITIIVTNNLAWWPQELGTSTLLRGGDQKVFIVPHGGAKLLYPENTVFAYWAMDFGGYDIFEVDLALTQDDQLISHHDLDIQGTTGIKNQPVASLTYQELSQYNFGATFQALDGSYPYANLDPEASPREKALLETLVPARLEDLFVAFPEKHFLLELKDTMQESGVSQARDAADELVRLIYRYNMADRVTVSSFDDQVIKYLNHASEGLVNINFAASTRDTMLFAIASSLKLGFFIWPQYNSLMLPAGTEIQGNLRNTIEKLPGFLKYELAYYDPNHDTWFSALEKQSIINDAHKLGIATFYWTVNSPQKMQQLIQLGVDGIITDRPDILSELISSRNTQKE
jgi:glycerophosphoryl diester phosphodiesterase